MANSAPKSSTGHAALAHAVLVAQAPIADYTLQDVLSSPVSSAATSVHTCSVDVSATAWCSNSATPHPTSWSPPPAQTPVPHAITNMKEGKVGSIVVTDSKLASVASFLRNRAGKSARSGYYHPHPAHCPDGRVKGMLSEKDYVLNLDHGAFCPSTIVAAHVMRPRVVTGQPSTPLIE